MVIRKIKINIAGEVKSDSGSKLPLPALKPIKKAPKSK
jgi:hypothetical protein